MILIGYTLNIEYCAIIKDSSLLDTHVILWSFICFSLVYINNNKKKFSKTNTAINIWETPNENVLLFWPWLKSEMMTMMCWYDTFLSPYWIFMLHWNSDLQRASVGSHVSLTRPAFSEHTLRNCYGNWLLWVIWHHHTLNLVGGRGSCTTKARNASEEKKLLFWYLNELWDCIKKLAKRMASGRES